MRRTKNKEHARNKEMKRYKRLYSIKND